MIFKRDFVEVNQKFLAGVLSAELDQVLQAIRATNITFAPWAIAPSARLDSEKKRVLITNRGKALFI